MEKESKKVKFGLVLTPETFEKVEQLYKSDNAEFRSEFIERAIIFYCAYLSSENYSDYLPKIVISTIKSILDAFETRMSKLLFNTNVELSVLSEVTAATIDTSELNLHRIRANCVKQVQQTHGFISLIEAVKKYEENK